MTDCDLCRFGGLSACVTGMADLCGENTVPRGIGGAEQDEKGDRAVYVSCLAGNSFVRFDVGTESGERAGRLICRK